MKKRKIILSSIIGVCICTLSLNFFLTNEKHGLYLFFEHIEALAGEENPQQKSKCTASGYICIETDKDGAFHIHPGLMEASKQ